MRTLEAGGIPAPRLIAAAAPTELPPYVFTTAVPGASAEESWEALPRAEQLAVAHAFGAVTAAYHQLPHQQLAAIEQTFGGGAESIRAGATVGRNRSDANLAGRTARLSNGTDHYLDVAPFSGHHAGGPPHGRLAAR